MTCKVCGDTNGEHQRHGTYVDTTCKACRAKQKAVYARSPKGREIGRRQAREIRRKAKLFPQFLAVAQAVASGEQSRAARMADVALKKAAEDGIA
jgi:hypothetical protein